MEDNDLYQVIFKRKSIRKYDLTPLDENRLKEISDHLQTLEPLHEDIKIEFKIIGTDDVKRRMMKKAPHYIAVFSEVKEGYLTNVGFILQQMDLFLSANGLGTCWQGIPKPKKTVLNSSDLKFIILLAFGNPNEPLHRENITEFKRKPLNEITDIKSADNILEAAHLAPSATNSQLWYFKGNKNLIHVYTVKPSFVKRLMAKKYIPIDVGIAIYHLKLAAAHYGKNAEIIVDIDTKNEFLEGYDYIMSLKL